jgi:hypothetical protein
VHCRRHAEGISRCPAYAGTAGPDISKLFSMMRSFRRLCILALAAVMILAVKPVLAERVCETANPTNCYEREAVAVRAPVQAWASWGKQQWDSAQMQCKGRDQFATVEGTACWFIDMFMAQCRQTKIPEGVSRACQRAGLKPSALTAFVGAVVDNKDGIQECKVFVEAFSGFKADTSGLPKAKIKKVEELKKKLVDLQVKVDAKLGVSTDAVGRDLMDAYNAYDKAKGIIEAEEKVMAFANLMRKVGGLKSLWAHAGGVAQPELTYCFNNAKTDDSRMACLDNYSGSRQITADVAASQAVVDYLNTTGAIQCLTATEAVLRTLR